MPVQVVDEFETIKVQFEQNTVACRTKSGDFTLRRRFVQKTGDTVRLTQVIHAAHDAAQEIRFARRVPKQTPPAFQPDIFAVPVFRTVGYIDRIADAACKHCVQHSVHTRTVFLVNHRQPRRLYILACGTFQPEISRPFL